MIEHTAERVAIEIPKPPPMPDLWVAVYWVQNASLQTGGFWVTGVAMASQKNAVEFAATKVNARVYRLPADEVPQ